MSFEAKVYQILVASPSDVQEERKVITETIYRWNALNSFDEKVVLLPVKWETHSRPEYRGEDTQGILNDQFVRNCDILIGVFWTKIGTPTANSGSGTLEEIEELVGQNKPIMLYFSNASLPNDVDIEQLQKVREFKDKYQNQGIYGTYNDNYQLSTEIMSDLTREVRALNQGERTVISVPPKKTAKNDSESRKKALNIEINSLFRENERIFKEYGPHSLRAERLVSDSAEIWKQKCVEVLIPNNDKIDQLLSANIDLIPQEKLDLLDKFKNHIEGFKENHMGDLKDRHVPLFPKKIINILEEEDE
ncbi:hypothetical protein [Ornithinibacillus xuwenensis]|uniref:DUF4062 domain-containing protein n=1 Tax=Ornithinibacillus xuwenensis TaxID=3144668 RepID=A0ABU9XEX8_9BACI